MRINHNTFRSLNETITFIQNPTLPKVIDYIKTVVKGHKTSKSDIEYAIEDLENVQKALEQILKTGKIK